MEHGDMTLPLLSIITFGFIAGMSAKNSRSLQFFLGAICAVTSVIAVVDGYYWPIFETYSTYADRAPLLGGITSNQFAAITILVSSFVLAHWQGERHAARQDARRRS